MCDLDRLQKELEQGDIPATGERSDRERILDGITVPDLLTTPEPDLEALRQKAAAQTDESVEDAESEELARQIEEELDRLLEDG